MNAPAVTNDIPDGWIAVAEGDLQVIVAAPAARRAEIETAARAGLVALLDALGPRLSELPDFAVADTSAVPTRVLVRGRAWASAGSVEGRSLGRMPWRELEFDDPVTLHGAPAVRMGWQMPSRFTHDDDAASAAPPAAGAEAPAPLAEVPAPAPVPPAADAAPAPLAEVLAPAPAPSPADAAPAPAPEAPAPMPVPTPPPADLTLPPPTDEDSGPPAQRVPPAPARSTSVIDSVPWRRPASSTPAASPPAPTSPPSSPPVPAPSVPAGPPVAPVAPPPPPPPVGIPPVPPPAWGTAPTTTRQAPPPPPPAGPPAPPPLSEVTQDRQSLATLAQAAGIPGSDGPIVLAVLCPAGHASSPHSGSCRVCGRDIPPQQPFQTPRPRLGHLRISTGGVVPLDRGVLLGRAPRVNADLPPNARPHLVRLASADNDLSRNHAEIVLEGWHVLVRDLGSTNGTTVALPGQPPVRLRPTEDQGIEPGTVITLADEVTLVYEAEA